MPKRRRSEPDLLDMLADLDRPEVIAAPREFCVHSTIHRMLTGGSIFVNEWVHAECLLPMEPPEDHYARHP